MTISVTLPDGKNLLFTKGEKGVEKLFITDLGEVVVISATSITKFGNCQYIAEYDKKEEKEKDIKA